MEEKKVKIKVCFRKFDDGQIIALFPDEKQSNTTILSYMHIGQHSEASGELMTELNKATPEEYKSLQKELENIGYILTVTQ